MQVRRCTVRRRDREVKYRARDFASRSDDAHANRSTARTVKFTFEKEVQSDAPERSETGGSAKISSIHGRRRLLARRTNRNIVVSLQRRALCVCSTTLSAREQVGTTHLPSPRLIEREAIRSTSEPRQARSGQARTGESEVDLDGRTGIAFRWSSRIDERRRRSDGRGVVRWVGRRLDGVVRRLAMKVDAAARTSTYGGETS